MPYAATPRPFKFPSPLGEGIWVRPWGGESLAMGANSICLLVIMSGTANEPPFGKAWNSRWQGLRQVLARSKTTVSIDIKCHLCLTGFQYISNGGTMLLTLLNNLNNFVTRFVSYWNPNSYKRHSERARVALRNDNKRSPRRCAPGFFSISNKDVLSVK